MSIKFRQSKTVVTSRQKSRSVWTDSSREITLGAQWIDSLSHPYWLLGRTSQDIGGPFTSHKFATGPLPPVVHLEGGPDLSSYDRYNSVGQLVPAEVYSLVRGSNTDTVAKVNQLTPAETPNSELEALGTTAIARSNPASPVFEGATAVAELFGGVPALPTRAGNIGSEYLNYQFAVAPTLADEQTLRFAAENSEKIIAQLERDSGKPVRRSYEFPPPESISSEVSGTFQPQLLAGGVPTVYEASAGTYTKRTRSTETTKFSGNFTYHLPPKGTWRRKIAELDAVYGIRPGVDTAWNLVPFSWMADWYANMGDVMTNLNAFALDGNVLRYAYIMRMKKTVISYNWTFQGRLLGSRNAWSQQSGSFEVSYSTFQRLPASPFGFGVSGGALTPRRIAILAALGIASK